LPFDKFLLLQADSMICRRDWSRETGLARFVRWDFVGAPWGDGKVGNGGFSWRSRAAHLDVLRRFPPPEKLEEHEDGYFSRHMRKVGASTAPADEARLFAVEGPPLPPHGAKPWGMHKAWATRHAGFVRVLSRMCTGYPQLARLHTRFEHESSGTQSPSSAPVHRPQPRSDKFAPGERLGFGPAMQQWDSVGPGKKGGAA
jgi:hypothetical protein